MNVPWPVDHDFSGGYQPVDRHQFAAAGAHMEIAQIRWRGAIRVARLKDDRVLAMLTKVDWVILDELGSLPLSSSGGALLFHLKTVAK